MVEAFCQETLERAEHEGHELELKCWHYVVFPVWIWKTFIHAKHLAFHHKFDSKALKQVEDVDMKGIGIAMYSLTFIYLIMMFVLPTLHINGECGDGISLWVYILYIVQGLVTAIYEVWAVKRIEKRI